MKYAKKSLGQNFLIDKNIIKKIINLIFIKNKDIIEIGPGKGALTDEILTKKPKSLILIEKDYQLSEHLKKKYKDNKNVRIYCEDFLKFDFKKVKTKNCIVFGNLPYNVSSQILIKFIRYKNISTIFERLIFMFQKELGDKIVSVFPSANYGRITILRSYNLEVKDKFLISPNSFFPKPNVKSMVIHLEINKNKKYKIKKISNLEKITHLFFSNKRKMIKKNIERILSKKKIHLLSNLNLSLRPTDLNPEIFFKITELYEGK